MSRNSKRNCQDSQRSSHCMGSRKVDSFKRTHEEQSAIRTHLKRKGGIDRECVPQLDCSDNFAGRRVANHLAGLFPEPFLHMLKHLGPSQTASTCAHWHVCPCACKPFVNSNMPPANSTKVPGSFCQPFSSKKTTHMHGSNRRQRPTG